MGKAVWVVVERIVGLLDKNVRSSRNSIAERVEPVGRPERASRLERVIRRTYITILHGRTATVAAAPSQGKRTPGDFRPQAMNAANSGSAISTRRLWMRLESNQRLEPLGPAVSNASEKTAPA